MPHLIPRSAHLPRPSIGLPPKTPGDKTVYRTNALATVAFALTLALPIPGRASTLTLWGQQSISLSGNHNNFCGWAHSNGTVNVSGPYNSMSGRLECVGSTINNKSGLQIVPAASAPMPQPPHDVAYYRALAKASGMYFPGTATLATDNLVLNGVVFAETSINLSGQHATGKATLVAAHGNVTISGSQNALTSGVDGLLLFAAEGNISTTGNHNDYVGSFFAPAGVASIAGPLGSIVDGQVVARAIDWSSSHSDVGGPCCTTSATCNDGDPCSVDVCDSGACDANPIPGCIRCATDVECNDGSVCTVDACVGGKCVFTAVADGTPCPDNDACNGQETCSAGICQAGTALSCGDGNLCTDDTCDPALGCLNTPVPGRPCDNDTVCDGHEACDATGACAAGPAPSCDDGNACTIDSCDPVSGCVNQPLTCDDGSACTAD